ncbi:MAG: hypothetical protein Q9207_005233 [Kuettlingeria erythrocarpa]
MAQLYSFLLAVLAIAFHAQRLVSAMPVENEKRQAAEVPPFVLSYGLSSQAANYCPLVLKRMLAPKVWLQSQDPHFPSDIGAQLAHTKPQINFVEVAGAPNPLTLDNLASLNALGGQSVYLTSVDDITKNPAWLNGVKPDASGKTDGATSCAVIVNDHGAGNVDAYYMYFYAFDVGNTVLGQEVGNHVGDWEHNMIRFKDGIPQAVW